MSLSCSGCAQDEGLSIDGWLELARECREDYKARKSAGGMKHVGKGQEEYDDDDEEEDEEEDDNAGKQLEEIKAKVSSCPCRKVWERA